MKSMHIFQKIAIVKTELFLLRTVSNLLKKQKKIEANSKYLRMLIFSKHKRKIQDFYYICKKLKQ